MSDGVTGRPAVNGGAPAPVGAPDHGDDPPALGAPPPAPTFSGKWAVAAGSPATPAPMPTPPLPHRLATVMVFNLLIPVAVLALFKGFGDYQAVYDQTYGKSERWTATLANVWEPIVDEASASNGRVGVREITLRLRRAVHRLLLETQRDMSGVRYAALLEPGGRLIAAAGEWPPDRLGPILRDLLPRAVADPAGEPVGTSLLPADGYEEFIVVRPLSAGAGDDPAGRRYVLTVFDSAGVKARFNARLTRLFGLDAGFALLVGILGYLLVFRFVIRPVRELHRGAVQIASGNLAHRLPADSPDELGLLAAGFNVMAERLSAGYRELEDRNERLRADRAYAGRLQRRLLPARLPEPEGIRFSVRYEPCEDLGGDFYDVFPLDRGRVALYVADVSGHGIGAALITVFIRETISRLRDAEVRDLLVSPAATLSALRDRFAEEDFGSLFVSMVYGVLDTNSGTFRFASAGHPMPLLASGGVVREAADEGGPVICGFLPDLPFPEHEVELPPGSRLLLYTDGAVDVMGPDGRQFGMSRLRRMLSEPTRLPGREWADHLMTAVREHVGDQPLTDDVTLLTISIAPAPTPAPPRPELAAGSV